MIRPIQMILRFSLVLAALCIGAAPSPQGQVEDGFSQPEARLRKLHLVRPDLIPYPLYFEVVC